MPGHWNWVLIEGAGQSPRREQMDLASAESMKTAHCHGPSTFPGRCQERPAAGRRALCKSHRELLQRAAGSYTHPYRPARAPCHCFPFFRDDRGLPAAVSTCAALMETRADIDHPFPRADSDHPFSRADRPCVPHSTCWPLRLASQGPHTQPSPTLQACVANAPGWMIRRENEASGLR
jgi:hypothetical protein